MALLFVPRESAPRETRVAATPETVKGFRKLGLEVAVEAGAGFASGYRDADFEAAGAQVADRRAEADLVLAVRTPTPEWIAGLRRDALLVAGLMPSTQADAIRALRDAGVTAFGMELVPRITRAQKMDVLSSQATCAGYKAVLLAAVALPRFFPMLMTAAGTIKPSKAFVLGAGVAGLQAISTARRLGAVVEANDVRPAVKEQVESLGAQFVDTGTPPDAETAGGYAKEASADYLNKQREILTRHVADADVVITTALIPGRPAPRLVTDAMLAGMRPGSVVVDLAAASGGNVEGSVADETVLLHDVQVIGESNLPAICGADASRMWARNVLGFAELLIGEGAIAPKWDDEIVTACCVTRSGEVVHRAAREAIGEGA